MAPGVEESELIIPRGALVELSPPATTFIMYRSLARESCSKFVTASRNRNLYKSFRRKLTAESFEVYFQKEETCSGALLPKVQFFPDGEFRRI